MQSSGRYTFSALEAQKPQTFNFTFNLDRNCIVSDKSESLCFLYGSEALANGLTQLAITVKPHPHIQGIIGIFESPFQFTRRGCRSREGWVEYKLKPPLSRELAQLDELNICFQFEGAVLKLRYEFKIRSFDTSTSQGKIKKTKRSFDHSIASADYLLTEQHLNHIYIETKISEALKNVGSGF